MPQKCSHSLQDNDLISESCSGQCVFVQLFQVTLLFEVQHLSNFTLCHLSNASHTNSEVDLYNGAKRKVARWQGQFKPGSSFLFSLVLLLGQNNQAREKKIKGIQLGKVSIRLSLCKGDIIWWLENSSYSTIILLQLETSATLKNWS